MTTVLIVDDEVIVSEVLRSFLTDEGYHVLTAVDGYQALQRMAEGPFPDLVISDLMMPVLDGAGLLQAVQNIKAQRSIPCIVMSEVAEAEVRKRTTSYAAFLRKPFHVTVLLQLVATVLNTVQPRRASQLSISAAAHGFGEPASIAGGHAGTQPLP